MRIENAKIFADGAFTEGAIVFDHVIRAVEAAPIGDDFVYVLPGLVDLHTHGAVGHDWSDGDPRCIQPMAAHYARHGVTSFLATTMTLPEDALTQAVTVLAEHPPVGAAKCAGVHLEGPFLSRGKRGAQAAAHLRAPDLSMLRRLDAASAGMLRRLTIAPELEGACEVIAHRPPACSVTLGHTEADYQTALRGFAAGATGLTHLFNAMPPLLHRDPGPIGAALTARASAELIADGLHVHPAAVLAAHRLFGRRLVLISDSLRAAGMPDGAYTLGGQPITVADGRATLADGTLAGSTITVLDGLRNCVRFGIPLADAVYAATAAPADAAGLRCGRILPGRPADLLVLNQSLDCMAVFLDGQRL